MLIVLDSNIYIFALGLTKVTACGKLMQLVINNPSLYTVRICRGIINEIRLHLPPEDFQRFIGVINLLTKIDEDFFIPFELGAKYETKGLKASDAFIAAYTEWTGADVLVTENRHFLSRKADLPFKVFTAEACLRALSK